MASSTHKAGGGLSEAHRTVRTLDSNTLAHLRRIYESHAGPDKKWGKAQIAAFFNEVQLHDPAEPTGTRLLSRDELDFDGWLSFMTSSLSAISTPPKAEDLSWPLNSYYISSSHNTYLSGNQLSSDSTTDAYTNVLMRGCRCVEVDVWDGDDSDTSESSSDEEKGKTRQRKQKKKEKEPPSGGLSRYGSVKKRLPRSLTARFEKTSLGKKLEQRESKKEGSPAKDAAPTPEKASEISAVETEEKDEPEVAAIEPRVLHGYTLTKEISFRDVCEAIRDGAFKASDLPLIVSLEVHCGPAQQAIMVKIMKDTWANYLVPEPDTDVTELPSPEELRNKILVKVKYAPPGSSPGRTPESEEDDRAPGDGSKKANKTPSKIIQDLSRLGIFTRGISFKSFAQPEAAMPNHIFSLSEKKFLGQHEDNGKALWEHNKNFLMRTYPKGLRIDSSNLNPAPFWGGGAQIVALNWQQTDEGMMLNEGMFAGTGGYVLKPEGYRPDIEKHPSPNKMTFKTLNLTLTFYAGQSIPIPPGDKSSKSFEPYVKVELHVDATEGQGSGHITSDGHEREGEYKAKTKTHKGCDNIDFGGEKLMFKNVPGLIEELAFVRFTIRDDELGHDDLAAWACVRLDRLGNGYRFIHLMDAEGNVTGGVVLVKVEKKLV